MTRDEVEDAIWEILDRCDSMLPSMLADEILDAIRYDNLVEIVDELSTFDPVRRITFGHGSEGKVCVMCGGSDYKKPDVLAHNDACLWVKALTA